MTWRHLMPALVAQGFRVVAPNLRGYAPSSVPTNGHYDLRTLADDAAALHEALGGDDRSVIIGHDWGAAAALTTSVRHRQRWRFTIALSWPPTGGVAVDTRSLAQLRRSWYVFFFRQPGADLVIGPHLAQALGGLWADWSPTYDARADVERAVEALGRPENLAAAMAYYQALPTFDDPGADPIVGGPQPTLYLHGEADGCLGIETTEGIERHLSEHSRVVRINGIGHFPHLENPTLVNSLIVDFIS
jgi:pimeloyl-ACP methyl ester carboxylesterase